MNNRFTDSELVNSELPEDDMPALIKKKEAPKYAGAKANLSDSSFDLEQGCSAEEFDTMPADLMDLFLSNKK